MFFCIVAHNSAIFNIFFDTIAKKSNNIGYNRIKMDEIIITAVIIRPLAVVVRAMSVVMAGG